MAVSLPSASGGKGARSVDFDLNLVPFIDMMSVIVAFLLITAVWTTLSRIDVGTKVAAGSEPEASAARTLSVLVTNDGVWLGVPGAPVERVPATGFEDALARLAAAHVVAPDTVVEVAADDAVAYQDLVTTMDQLVGRKLDAIRYVDPGALSVRFRE